MVKYSGKLNKIRFGKSEDGKNRYNIGKITLVLPAEFRRL